MDTQGADNVAKTKTTKTVMPTARWPAAKRTRASDSAFGSMSACSNLPVPSTAVMPVTSANISRWANVSGEYSRVRMNAATIVTSWPASEPPRRVAIRFNMTGSICLRSARRRR